MNVKDVPTGMKLTDAGKDLMIGVATSPLTNTTIAKKTGRKGIEESCKTTMKRTIDLSKLIDLTVFILLISLSLINLLMGLFNNVTAIYWGIYFQGQGLWTVIYYADLTFIAIILTGYGTIRIHEIAKGANKS
jgi:hypothetical protein